MQEREILERLAAKAKEFAEQQAEDDGLSAADEGSTYHECFGCRSLTVGGFCPECELRIYDALSFRASALDQAGGK